MKNAPDKIREVVPAHIEYWRKCNLEGYMGGPFADRSGGLITFLSTNLEDAKRIIMNDPFVSENLIENNWIKEWVVE